jgi:hypothetical protein
VTEVMAANLLKINDLQVLAKAGAFGTACALHTHTHG